MKIIDNRTLDIGLSLDPTEDSAGIVIGDRDETGSNNLKVFIPRFMQGIDISDGKPKEETENLSSSKIKNSISKNIGSSSIKLKNYIEVPPFVVPGTRPPRFAIGERVLIKFFDNDIKTMVYYPYQVAGDTAKRLTDIQRMYVPAKTSQEDPVTDEDSYFLELNSRDKFVRVFTSNKNEEKCPFTFNINTKDGVVTFKDDTERSFEWNYDEDKISFKTNSGIVFELKENAVTLNCETLKINASESINVETSKFKLKADQGDVLIDNMYVKNTSYEQRANNSKLKYDLAELSGSLWQIISTGLYLNAPITINTGMSVFAGFYITEIPAPGKTPSVYAGGALDGASPQSSVTPKQQKPNSKAPSSKKSGSTSITDFKGAGKGKALAYAEPVIDLLKTVAKQADKGVGLAKYHMHPGEYKPLAMNPVSPATPKPAYAMEMTSQMKVNANSMKIKANNVKA